MEEEWTCRRCQRGDLSTEEDHQTLQEHSGTRIKGLLINFVRSFWFLLLEVLSILLVFIALPIVKLLATMVAGEKKEEEGDNVMEEDQVVTAVYKLNLHCGELTVVLKAIKRERGLRNINIDMESGKVTFKGIFNPKLLHEVIEKMCERKVEWLLPNLEDKTVKKDDYVENMQKEKEDVKTTVIKLHLHCRKCETDLEKKLQKLRGVYSVKADREEQTCVIVGIVEEEKLLEYIYKKTRKRGEIVPQR